MHIKRLLFGTRPRVFKILFGIGRGLRLYLDPNENAQRILGMAEAEVAASFRRGVRQCAKYIELGASDGYYCAVARRENSAAPMIAFEPQKRFESIARENFERNGLSTENYDWRVDLGGTTENPLSEALDGDGPFFIKIDIDGGELEALRSTDGILERFKGTLLVEVHSPQLKSQCLEFLTKHGFLCSCISQAWWRRIVPEERPLQLNEWIVAEKGLEAVRNPVLGAEASN
jgi:hypothetical protein